VARRAERRLVSLSKMHAIHPLALSYVNRLSDYLFVFARYINYVTEHSDIEV
jgi:cob(I)alamin adenosyltransferase